MRSPSARGLRIAIVASRFHAELTEELLRGARELLTECGVGSRGTKVFRCPGSFELPQVAERLARSKRWDAIVCLGVVIRGETPHFEYVAAEAARGIQDVALRWGLPVAFGVLTTDTERQARARAGGRLGNKGRSAALAAVEMALLFKKI